jgi:hypothetical protein
MVWHHADGCWLKDLQLSHERTSLQTSRQVRHQIPIWRHAGTWLSRWPVRTQNNAHSTKNHNLPSHVAFVDLVKAYNTANNHNILLDILERYGAPPHFIAAVARIYRDLIVVLKIEKEIVELPQTVGVRQGDNMAPVLFLFLMSAFAETLEVAWREAGIEVCTVQSVTGTRLTAGNLARNLTAVEIFQCFLYVDDGAFISSSRDNLIQGIDLIHNHFARLGLEMHIG